MPVTILESTILYVALCEAKTLTHLSKGISKDSNIRRRAHQWLTPGSQPKSPSLKSPRISLALLKVSGFLTVSNTITNILKLFQKNQFQLRSSNRLSYMSPCARQKH